MLVDSHWQGGVGNCCLFSREAQLHEVNAFWRASVMDIYTGLRHDSTGIFKNIPTSGQIWQVAYMHLFIICFYSPSGIMKCKRWKIQNRLKEKIIVNEK